MQNFWKWWWWKQLAVVVGAFNFYGIQWLFLMRFGSSQINIQNHSEKLCTHLRHESDHSGVYLV